MITISKDQQNCLDLIAEGHNMFISGKAGSGKSFLIGKIKELYPTTDITASTGMAALNIDGSTIHSFSGFFNPDIGLDHVYKTLSLTSRFKISSCTRLIIDEVSMISNIMLDFLDCLYRLVRKDDRPFGGIQVMLFGDLLQIPPVSDKHSNVKHNFCFMAKVFKEGNFKRRLLDYSFRQGGDKEFADLLDRMRFAELTVDDKKLLMSRNNLPVPEGETPVHLFSNNKEVEILNYKYYSKLEEVETTFNLEESGEEPEISRLKDTAPCMDPLVLKIGTQVMCLDNRFSKSGIVNGSVGVVTGFTSLANHVKKLENSVEYIFHIYKASLDLSQYHNNEFDIIPIVKFESNNLEIPIPYNVWSKTKLIKNSTTKVEEEIEIARITQMSLRQAWAITIHKSQGIQVKCLVADLGKVFSDGQAYVACSRVTSLKGLYLRNLDFRKITANREMVNFYKNMVNDLYDR